MRKLIRSIITFALFAMILYIMEDKYHISEWVINLIITDKNQEEDFIQQVRQAMLDGKEEFVVRYIGKFDNMNWFTDEAIDQVYSIDDEDTSSDFDYLRYKVESIYAKAAGFGNILTVSYEIKYTETASETKKVDEKIKEILNSWNVEKLSDYEKVKKIHDFIIKNASYDREMKKYSAYDNLFEKTSTCQGYMSLAYKMMTEAGVPCRVITGSGNGEAHGWNIVSIEGKWYNLDCTWDDPITWNDEEVISYDFFLKADKDFPDHKRDEEFESLEFHNVYAMSSDSFME